MEEKVVFKSKTGTGIILFLCLVLVPVSIISVVLQAWLGLFFTILVAAFILHMFLTTSYTFQGSILHIRCGFFFSKAVPVGSMRKISATRNPISSPAWSLDRLEILYHKFDTILISPENKTEFIQHIQLLHPAIEVKL